MWYLKVKPTTKAMVCFHHSAFKKSQRSLTNFKYLLPKREIKNETPSWFWCYCRIRIIQCDLINLFFHKNTKYTQKLRIVWHNKLQISVALLGLLQITLTIKFNKLTVILLHFYIIYSITSIKSLFLFSILLFASCVQITQMTGGSKKNGHFICLSHLTEHCHCTVFKNLNFV